MDKNDSIIELTGELMASRIFIDRFLVQVIQIMLTAYEQRHGQSEAKILVQIWEAKLQNLRGSLAHSAPHELTEQDTALCNQAAQDAISALSADFLSKLSPGAGAPPPA